jgi:hypothetical protein
MYSQERFIRFMDHHSKNARNLADVRIRFGRRNGDGDALPIAMAVAVAVAVAVGSL